MTARADRGRQGQAGEQRLSRLADAASEQAARDAARLVSARGMSAETVRLAWVYGFAAGVRAYVELADGHVHDEVGSGGSDA